MPGTCIGGDTSSQSQEKCRAIVFICLLADGVIQVRKVARSAVQRPAERGLGLELELGAVGVGEEVGRALNQPGIKRGG